MLETVTLQNYKSHERSTLHLGRRQLAVLVGPNGSGKSSVLEGLSKLCDYQRWSNSPSQQHPRQRVEAQLTSDQFAHAVRPWDISKTQRDVLLEASGATHDEPWTTRILFSHLDGGWACKTAERTVGSIVALEKTPYLRLRGSNLAKNHPMEFNPRLAQDGTGLPALIAYLMTTEPDIFQNIQESLREIAPMIQRVRTQPVAMPRAHIGAMERSPDASRKTGDEIGYQLLFDTTGRKGIPASAMSDGTLILLGLLTLLWSQEPRLLLIDDLDHALHPSAQRDLLQCIRKVLEHRHELQIIATTHSPYLVDELEADELWVLSLDHHGTTHMRHLPTHPDAAQALETLTTGEFWSSIGESWVLEAKG